MILVLETLNLVILVMRLVVNILTIHRCCQKQKTVL